MHNIIRLQAYLSKTLNHGLYFWRIGRKDQIALQLFQRGFQRSLADEQSLPRVHLLWSLLLYASQLRYTLEPTEGCERNWATKPTWSEMEMAQCAHLIHPLHHYWYLGPLGLCSSTLFGRGHDTCLLDKCSRVNQVRLSLYDYLELSARETDRCSELHIPNSQLIEFDYFLWPWNSI